MTQHRYQIGDFERMFGIPRRTIRYYVSEGILPPAHGRGPTAWYDETHLRRLRAHLLKRTTTPESVRAISNEISFISTEALRPEDV